jgi:hypothetical protein
MPKYLVELEDGRKFHVEADGPPSPEDVLAQLGDTPSQPEPEGPSLVDRAAGALPMVGGAIGSMAGGVPGAAIGGAAGQGFGQLLSKAGEIPGAVADVARNLVEQPGATLQGFGEGAMTGAKDAGITGAIQGGVEGLGRGVGRLMTSGARRLYQSALKPSVAIRREFPDVVATGLREGVNVSRRGGEKAGQLLTQSTQQADDVIRQASGSASPVRPRELGPALHPAREEAGKRAAIGLADDTPEIAERLLTMHRRNPRGIPLDRAQALKKTAQDQADSAYRTMERGASIRAVDPQTNVGIARGLREAIEARVPAVSPINQRTQALKGLDKAISEAEGRIGNTLPQMVGMRGLLSGGAGLGAATVTGSPILGALFGGGSALLTNPTSASMIARGLNRAGPATGAVLPQATRAALLALLEQSGDQP